MCCLFGLIDYNNVLSMRRKEKIIKILSQECEARGTDATGVAYLENAIMKIHKQPLPAHKMRFKFKTNPAVIMGHTRMTTQGSELNNYNNHPFYSTKLGFALAHNGVLYNDIDLRKSEKLPKTHIETDSYIALQLIEKTGTFDFSSIKYMAEKVKGSFCFTMLNSNNQLYIVKGDNPMAIASFNGFYIYASTDTILNKALKRLKLNNYKKVNISQGDIFRFEIDGSISTGNFEIEAYDYFKYSYGWKGLDNDYLEDLIYYGKTIGVDEKSIRELIDLGYDYMDIEEMLYDTEYFDYCKEDDFCAEI